jgi:hypothetical protein
MSLKGTARDVVETLAGRYHPETIREIQDWSGVKSPAVIADTLDKLVDVHGREAILDKYSYVTEFGRRQLAVALTGSH